MNVTPVTDALTVKRVEDLSDWYVGSNRFVVLECGDYDAFRSLPRAVVYDGEVYARTGWNSDRREVYYSNKMKVAYSK